jgi:hypothetical protein
LRRLAGANHVSARPVLLLACSGLFWTLPQLKRTLRLNSTT